MANIKRGRSQILFSYLPGSIFSEKGLWFQVKELRVRELTENTDHLLEDIYKFIGDWKANNELDHNLYPNRDEMYFFGEIEEVNCDLFPLVFYCRNSNCRNTHSYNGLDELTKRNPQLICEFCKEGKIKQYPYALVHLNGDIQPLKVAVNKGATWKERHDGIRMNDTRRFTTATWYNAKSGKSLGSLGTKITTMPLNKTMVKGNKRFLGGTHLSEGDVYYPILRSYVNLKNETLIERQKHEKFAYYQMGALLNLASVNLNDFARNFEEKKDQDMLKKMLANAPNESAREMILKLAEIENVDLFLSDNTLDSEVESLFLNNTPIKTIKTDRSLHEFIFTWYENGGQTLDQKIKEAENSHNIEQKVAFLDAKSEMENMGVSSVLLLDKFPVLMLGVGYTRKSFDRSRAILNPFKQRIKNKDKIIIPVLKNDNEAIVFRLDPVRVLAWLSVNEFIDPPMSIKSRAEAHAYLYKHFIYTQIPLEDLIRLKPSDHRDNKQVLASIMCFRLLHTYMHVLFQSGKSLIGLDVDSMSEYLFPSSLSGAIYVSKLQGGGMGALIAAFDNDLAKWLRFTYDKSHTCLYDPVCREHHGACHACVYLKFSCRHFNHSLSRNVLTGGKIMDYDEFYEIEGYFSKRVEDLIGQWGN